MRQMNWRPGPIGGDRRLEGSITLLRLFVVASAAILVAGAVLLASALTRTMREEALTLKKTSLAEYAQGVLGPVVVHDDRVVTTRWLPETILRVLRGQLAVVSVKVWRPDGTLAYTTLDRNRIGHRFELDGELGEAIRDNRTVASIIGPHATGEDAAEAALGFNKLIQVYALLENASRTRAIGAYEIYANAAPLQGLISSRVHMIWFTKGRARDRRAARPLSRTRLEALGLAGLFHDIGKLRVPDAILTKPGPLTEKELELIKRHPEDGAEIVGHLRRLHDVLPFIRHHHERWDGRGYPAGLAGGDIPLEAAIVGLADAWDAMTTERPYSRARSFDEAIQEIRDGRGMQFAPAVVDAFLATLDIGLERSEPALAHAG
jgi:HD domain